ncbi:MAG TPA: tetratricopeptide repeat protein [Ignavibacteria bacterium]|nr:tetratricopeptide repeat protein [Ignavibacteria bacterium]
MQKLRINLLFVVLAAFIFTACGETKKPEEEYLNKALTELENKQYTESIATYRELIKNYPDSPNAIFAYNQIAGIYMDHLQDFSSGITAYKELSTNFPDTKEGKNALFMVAFTYDEKLQDKDNAIKSYKEFLAKYPEDTDPNEKMSESAKMMLEVLESGKSIEDLIEQKIMEQEKTNPTDTTSSIKEPEKTPEVNQKTPQDSDTPPVKESKTEQEKIDANK